MRPDFLMPLLLFLPLILLPWWLCAARLMKRRSALSAAVNFCVGTLFLLPPVITGLLSVFLTAYAGATAIIIGISALALLMALFFLARKFGFKGVIFPQFLLFVLILAWIRTMSGNAEPGTCATPQLILVQLSVFYETYFLLCVFIFWGAGKAIKHFRKERIPAEGKSFNADETDLRR